MNRIIKCILLTLLPFSLSHATFMSFQDNLSTQYMSTNGSSTGVFNISGIAGPSYVSPFDITSAYIVFNFSDDSDPFEYSNVSYGSYSTTGSRTSTYRYVQQTGPVNHKYVRTEDIYSTRDVTRDAITDDESSSVTIGGVTQTGEGSTVLRYTTGTNTRYTRTFDDQYFDRSQCVYYSGLICTREHDYYSDIFENLNDGLTTDTVDYTGTWNQTFHLSQHMLSDLSVDGLLSFTSTANFGDFYMTGATLFADITPIPAASGAVPEPSAIALMGLGLLGFGVTRRRKSQP